MKKDVTLKQIEKNAWRNYFFEDGLFDMLLGLSFMAALAGEFFASDYYLIVILFAFIPLFWGIKRYVVIPRIGLAKFGKETTRRRNRVNAVLKVSVLFFLLVSFLVKGGFFPNEGFPIASLLVGFSILIVLSLMGYLSNYDRLYVYGVMLGFGEPLGTWLEVTGALEEGTVVIVMISGVIILLGVVSFVGFLYKYPKPADING